MEAFVGLGRVILDRRVVVCFWELGIELELVVVGVVLGRFFIRFFL